MRAARRFLVALLAVLPLTTLVSISTSQATTADLGPWNHYVAGLWNIAGEYPHPAFYTIGPSFVACGTTPACSGSDSAAWQSDAGLAQSTWNALGSKFQFGNNGAFAEVPYGPGQVCSADPTTQGPSQLHGGSIDPGAIAETWVCFVNGNITDFQMTVSPSFPWYTSETGLPSSTQYDLQSAITHEFGHAFGWQHDHYRECTGATYSGPFCTSGLAASEPSDICASGTFDRGTMCATASIGSEELRDLASDDKAVFLGAYPKPTNGTGVDPCGNPIIHGEVTFNSGVIC